MWSSASSYAVLTSLLLIASMQATLAQGDNPAGLDLTESERDLAARWSTRHLRIYETGARRYVESLNCPSECHDKAADEFLRTLREARDVKAVGSVEFINPTNEYPKGSQGEFRCQGTVEWKRKDASDRAKSIIHTMVIHVDSGICVAKGAAGGGLGNHYPTTTTQVHSGAMVPRRAPSGRYVIFAMLTVTTQDNYTQLLDVKCHEFQVKPNPDEQFVIASLKQKLFSGVNDAALGEINELLNKVTIDDDIVMRIPIVENIQELDLAYAQLSDPRVNLIFHLPCLTNLSLRGTTLDDELLSHVRECGSLVSLDLGYTSAGVKTVQSLATLENLEYVNIEFTAVVDETLADLSRIKSLKTMRMTGCDVSPEGVARFSQLRPEVKVIW